MEHIMKKVFLALSAFVVAAAFIMTIAAWSAPEVHAADEVCLGTGDCMTKCIVKNEACKALCPKKGIVKKTACKAACKVLNGKCEAKCQ
jgi:hypothetical protein